MDLIDLAQQYLQGKTLRQIAAWFCQNRPYKLSRQTILNDLRRVREDWKEKRVCDFDAKIAEELAKIDHVEAQAWEGWERSCAEFLRTTSERSDGGKHNGQRASVVKENQTGDPRFLAMVMQCVDRRCRLLGLDAPTRTEIAGPDGGPIQTHAHGEVRLIEPPEIMLPRNGRDFDNGRN